MPESPDFSAAARREAHWRRVWQSRTWPAWAWWPLAQVHGGLVRLRRLAYTTGLVRSERVACPVLVIGNVLVGGAGKTPTTLALVQHLQARGVRVGVVSRGHGREGHAQAALAVTPPSDARQVGDEPLLIHLRTGAPVFVARQRAAAARALLAAHPDTQLIVCDDGLQHLALARDLQLCVFDERGVGNGWLLPAGPLREPWPVAVDWALQIHDAGRSPRPLPPSAAPVFGATRQLADHALDARGRRVPLAALGQRAVVAFAGIAKPEVFFAALRAQGLVPAREIGLGDHGNADEHAELAALLRQGVHEAAAAPKPPLRAAAGHPGEPGLHQAARTETVMDTDTSARDAQPLDARDAPPGGDLVGGVENPEYSSNLVFSTTEIDPYSSSPDSEAPILLCTEKDAVKLWPRYPQVLAVPLQLSLPAELLAAVDARVDALLRRG